MRAKGKDENEEEDRDVLHDGLFRALAKP
jgi:hypothetical protein